MSKTKNKKLKYLWLILPIAIIIAILVITIINSQYTYEPYNKSKVANAGDKVTLTLIFDGADDCPEREEIECTAFEKVTLPKLTKEGYNFYGWNSNGNFVGNEIAVCSKDGAYAYAQFEKDYSAINSDCALFNDEFEYTEYDAGEYAEINAEIVDIFLNGGYKATIYSKPNFKGKETKIGYTGTYKGKVGSIKIEKINSNGIESSELDNNTKLMLLETYAPRIWWAENEEYFATTVENASKNMERVMSDNGYMYCIPDVDSSKYMNDYLHGSLTDCKAYAFAIEKEGKYLDLSYFVFTPYNKAKRILGIDFGNHIGDWEHITVRLMPYTENGKAFYRPTVVDYSYHSFRSYESWDELEIVDGTHPVAYTAWGSHGMWKNAGTHVYVNAVVLKLTDECSQGTAWDLWKDNAMETYSYDAKSFTGVGIGNSKWNTCFDLTYYDKDSNAVTNWGNYGIKPPIQIYAQLDNGPGGPQQKRSLNDYFTMNDKKR